jgi:beta-alanine--pyruvate transaminase
VDHLPHTHLPAKNAYCRGEPPHGAELADVLENLVALHGAETIAAVMVEPVAGSTGVLVPPVGYLKRLRDICTKHGILLIFDEVITGFGRLGANFGAERLGVTPDIMTMAKGLTNAAVPMGAVAVKNEIYDAIVQGTGAGIEFFHGYTYSGHPLAAAAAIATLELHRAEDLPGRARALEPYWQDAVHSLKGLPNVIDIRDVGLIGAVELAPRPGKPTQRALDVFRRCFDEGVLIRVTADIIAMSPPLICEKPHVDRLIGTLADAITAEAA